jgi:light-regulated signal transduction histidine kinase (bacteriophytochrome)
VYLIPERALDAPVVALVRKTVLGSALIIALAFAAGIAFAGRIAEQLSSREAQVRSGLSRLEAAHKELESFSYSVSHDLRAPLRHIAGFVDLLQRHAGATLDEKGQRYLATISAAAVRMGQLIDDLLSFSRMGRGELMKSRVELKPLVTDVARQLGDEQGARPVEWRIGDLGGVVGDPAMLRVVFTNLLSNALKYTRGRAPAVIEVGPVPGGNGDATVFVRDNGAGFDMQYVGKLFGVFQRLHSSHEFEGTGIGLATVRRIVDRHGGSVRAEGRPGAGATFYVTLPSAGGRE